MAWKNLKQRSLADSMLVDHTALRELDGVHELTDGLPLEKRLSGIYSKSKGEKTWLPIMMFKSLLL